MLYQQYTCLESVILEDNGAGKSNVAKSAAAAAAAAPPPASTPPSSAAAGVEQTATPAKKAPKRPKKREREAAAAAAAAAACTATAAATDAPPTAAAATPAVTAAPPAVANEAAAEAAPPPAAEGAEGAKKKRRRKRGKGGLGNGTTPSGPGNAEEAARIRDALGFADAAKKQKEGEKKEAGQSEKGEAARAAAAPASEPAAAAAPSAAAPSTTFQFGFSELENDAVPVEREAKPEEAAATAVEAAAGPSSSTAAADGADADAAPKRRARGGVKNQKRDGDSSFPSSSALSSGSQDPALARRVFVGGMPFKFEEAEVREYWSWCGEIESMSLLRFPDTGRFRGIAFITFADDEAYKKALECDGTMLEGVRVKVERCKVGARGAAAGAGASEDGGASAAAKGAAAKPAFDAPAPKTPGYNVAYVGNVAFEASAEDVAALFNEALAPGVGEANGSREEAREEAGAEAEAADDAADGNPSSLPLPPPPPRSAVTRVRLHTDKVTGKSRGYAHVHFLTEEQLDRAVAEVDGAALYGRAVRVGYAQPKKE